jgi:hypothetical protein
MNLQHVLTYFQALTQYTVHFVKFADFAALRRVNHLQ